MKKQTVKGLAIGLSALTLASSMDLTAFAADEETTGSGEQTQGTAEAKSDEEKLAESVEEAKTSVDTTITDLTSDKVVDGKDTNVDTTDLVDDMKTKDDDNYGKAMEGVTDDTKAAVDKEEQDLVDDKEAYDTAIDAAAAAMEQADAKKEEAAEQTEAAEDAATDLANSAATIENTTGDAEDVVDEAVVTITNATTIEAAQTAYDGAEDTVEAADAAYTAAEANYNTLLNKYNTAVAAAEAAAAAYDEAIGTTEYQLAKAQAALDAAQADLDQLTTALEEAEKDLAATAAAEITKLNDEATSWAKRDQLFYSIVKNYYITNVVDADATNIQVDEFYKESNDEYNYCKVTYEDANGDTQTLYLNYKLTNDNKDGGLLIFEKSDTVISASIDYILASNDTYSQYDIGDTDADGNAITYDQAGIKELLKADYTTATKFIVARYKSTVDDKTVYSTEYSEGATKEFVFVDKSTGKLEGDAISLNTTALPADADAKENTSYSQDVVSENGIYTTYGFDADGNFVSILHKNGTTTTVTYSAKETKQGDYTKYFDTTDLAKAAAQADLDKIANAVQTSTDAQVVGYVGTATQKYEARFVRNDIRLSGSGYYDQSKERSEDGKDGALKENEGDIKRDYVISDGYDDVTYNFSRLYATHDWGYHYDIHGTYDITFNQVDRTRIEYSDWQAIKQVAENLIHNGMSLSAALDKAAQEQLNDDNIHVVDTDLLNWSWKTSTAYYVKLNSQTASSGLKQTEAEAKTEAEANAKNAANATNLEKTGTGLIDSDYQGATSSASVKYGYTYSYMTKTTSTSDFAKSETTEYNTTAEGKFKASKLINTAYNEYKKDSSSYDLTTNKTIWSQDFNTAYTNWLANYNTVETLKSKVADAKKALETASTYVTSLQTQLAALVKENGSQEEATAANIKNLQSQITSAQADENQALVNLNSAKEKLALAALGLQNKIAELTPAVVTETTPAATTPATTTAAAAVVTTPAAARNVAATPATVQIADNQTPLAAEDDTRDAIKYTTVRSQHTDDLDGEEDIVSIDDTETPLGIDAAGMFKRSWWWLILIALLAAAGITAYEENKKKKAQANNDDDNE